MARNWENEKHVVVQAPFNGGNYTEKKSIQMRPQGMISDGGVFKNTSFYK